MAKDKKIRVGTNAQGMVDLKLVPEDGPGAAPEIDPTVALGQKVASEEEVLRQQEAAKRQQKMMKQLATMGQLHRVYAVLSQDIGVMNSKMEAMAHLQTAVVRGLTQVPPRRWWQIWRIFRRPMLPPARINALLAVVAQEREEHLKRQQAEAVARNKELQRRRADAEAVLKGGSSGSPIVPAGDGGAVPGTAGAKGEAGPAPTVPPAGA